MTEILDHNIESMMRDGYKGKTFAVPPNIYNATDSDKLAINTWRLIDSIIGCGYDAVVRKNEFGSTIIEVKEDSE